jgi:hypothetical protein
MDAVKFLQERKRMFKSGAPIQGIGLDDGYDPVRAVEVVEKWSAAHPVKTRQSVFLEQWPNAKIIPETNTLAVYPCVIEQAMQNTGRCVSVNHSCVDCRREFWMQEVE